MAGPVVCLRVVRTADELGPVVLLAGEFEEWVRARILADYGIDFEFKSERDLFLDLDGLLEPRARLYIAEINGEPVGIGGLRPLSADEAEIKRMYVRPSSRGLGVGRAILQRLIDDGRALGYRAIVSIVLASCTKRTLSTGASGSCPAVRTAGSSRACPRYTRPRSSCASISARTSQ